MEVETVFWRALPRPQSPMARRLTSGSGEAEGFGVSARRVGAERRSRARVANRRCMMVLIGGGGECTVGRGGRRDGRRGCVKSLSDANGQDRIRLNIQRVLWKCPTIASAPVLATFDWGTARFQHSRSVNTAETAVLRVGFSTEPIEH